MNTAHRIAPLGLLTGLVFSAGAALAGDATVGLIELEDPIKDRAKTIGLGGVSTELTMRDVLTAFDQAIADPAMKGIVIRMKDVPLSMSNVDELGAKIKQVRAAGKKVHLYAENFDTKELMLGSYCDEILAQRGGAVSLPGVYMEEMFLADTFKWIGVTPDFVQIGDYKGASEMMANAKPSKAWDENINQLLDSLYGRVRDTIKSGRKMDDGKLDAAMDKNWMAFAEDAQKTGLVDTIIDFPDLTDHLKSTYGGEITWDDALLPDRKAEMEKKMSNPLALLSELGRKPMLKPKRETIAVLHIDGAIIDGESTSGGIMGGEGQVGSRSIRRSLGEIEDNDKIKGCVIRVDSPGGSAIASEIIWQGVQRVAKHKPVWVSVGDMAASGGYYIAVSGSKIYVTPSSIVGSIGVVGGKMALGGVYEKLHINVVPRARGPHAATLAGTSSPWSAEDKAMVRAKMVETYELFTKRVSAGRSGIDLSKTAEGRLFVGKKAVDLKMADAIGGLTDAVGDLATKLGLSDGSYDIMDYPAPMSFGEMIENAMKGFGAEAPGVRLGNSGTFGEIATLAKQLVGPSNFKSLSSGMDALLQMRDEPVLLTSPRVLIFK